MKKQTCKEDLLALKKSIESKDPNHLSGIYLGSKTSQITFDNFSVLGIASPTHNPCKKRNAAYHQQMYLQYRCYSTVYAMMKQRNFAHSLASSNLKIAKLHPISTYKQFHDFFCDKDIHQRLQFLNNEWVHNSDPNLISFTTFLLGLYEAKFETCYNLYMNFQKNILQSRPHVRIASCLFVIVGNEAKLADQVLKVNQNNPQCLLEVHSMTRLATLPHECKLTFPLQKLTGISSNIFHPLYYYNKHLLQKKNMKDSGVIKEENQWTQADMVYLHFNPGLIEEDVKLEDVAGANSNMMKRLMLDPQVSWYGLQPGELAFQLAPCANRGFQVNVYRIILGAGNEFSTAKRTRQNIKLDRSGMNNKRNDAAPSHQSTTK